MLLAAGANPSQVNPGKNTPLHSVAHSPRHFARNSHEVETVEVLADAGVDIDAKND